MKFYHTDLIVTIRELMPKKMLINKVLPKLLEGAEYPLYIYFLIVLIAINLTENREIEFIGLFTLASP